jgi:hypothetical protein
LNVNKTLRHLFFSFTSIFLGLFPILSLQAVSMTQVNDDETRTAVNQYQYIGSWQYGSQTGAYQGDNHWSSSIGSIYQVNFLGTQIDLYAAKASSHGIAGVSINGGTEVLVDCYSASRFDNALIYSSPALNYGLHQVQVRVTGNKNTASSGFAVTADRAVIHCTNPLVTNVNDYVVGSNENQFSYTGSWNYGGQTGAYLSDNHWSNQTGSSYSIRFTGSQILVYGAQVQSNGIAAFSIDNGPAVNVDCYASTRRDEVLLYTSPMLIQGPHTLTVKVTGTKNANSTGFNLVADRVAILSYPQSVVPEPDFSYANLSMGLFRYRPLSLFNREWNIEVYSYGFSNYPSSAIEASSTKYNLADTFGDTYYNNLYEWDYTFALNSANGYLHTPTSAIDAYQMTKDWFSAQLLNITKNKPSWITSITGHYYYPHYGALWGGAEIDLLMSEVGENVKSINAHLAFVRGAARQFNKPWGLQFSPWYGGYVLDYTSPSVWGTAGGANYGHSLELAKRTYFLTYMSGGNELHAESASVDWFNGSTLNSDGTFNLSPMGLIAQNFYSFSHSFVDRGIPLTPMAIILDQYQGLNGINLSQTFYGMLAADNSIKVGFDYTAGLQMDVQLFNTLWPQSFSSSAWDESQFYLTNSAHGDMYDVLLDPVDLAVLRCYPVVYLGASVTMTADLATKLQEYVERGGTLVLNSSSIGSNFTSDFIGASLGTAQNVSFSSLTWNASGQSVPYTSNLSVPSFQATTATPLLIGASKVGTQTLASINSVGNGKVIVITPANMQDTVFLDFFVKSLIQPLNPFKIEGNIEYLVNRNSTGWVVTLINNLGVTKSPQTPAVIDATQAQTVQITYQEAGKTIQGVTEMVNNTPISVQGNLDLTITVPAGDVRVLNIPVF